jgi:hypothetical protein
MHFKPLIATALAPESRRLGCGFDLLRWHNLLHAVTIRKTDATNDEYGPELFRIA